MTDTLAPPPNGAIIIWVHECVANVGFVYPVPEGRHLELNIHGFTLLDKSKICYHRMIGTPHRLYTTSNQL